ncbi:hypothetical protein [Mycolicibacterium phlei]
MLTLRFDMHAPDAAGRWAARGHPWPYPERAAGAVTRAHHT